MTLQQRLDEAKAAYHALLTGAQARELRDQNGEMVVYTPANRASLRDYIAALEAQIASNGATPSRRPLQVMF